MRRSAKSIGYVGDQVNWSHPQARGLVGYWPLNDGAGVGARDLACRNNGTLVGAPSWKAGGLPLNGTSQYVLLPASASPKAFPFTLCARVFFNIDQPSGNYDYVIGVGEYGPTIDDIICIAREATTNRLYYIENSWLRAGPVISTAQWIHIGIVYFATSVRCFINGVENSIAQPSGTLTLTSGASTIGCFNRDYIHHLNGSVSDVRIYNRALTNTEIRDIYISPTAIYSPRSLILPANALTTQPPIYIGGQRISRMMLGGNEVSGAAIGSSRFW